jgi:tRNA pseudouridine55 synthase
MSYEGILPVYKPAGMTSHDVVSKVRRLISERRIGHTGTLDPQVTGVLPLCIGRATRLVEYIQDLPKQYEAELTVGISTDTEDRTGAITAAVDFVSLTEHQIRSVMQSFVGEVDQTPPMYSAVKVAGKRLYELAREGIEVERKSRKVQIYNIELLELKLNQNNPAIRFRVECSKGTYIRTLCVDIGRELNYPAHMSDLVRTGTGFITLDQCLTFDEIAMRVDDGTFSQALIPADQGIKHLPVVTLDEIETNHAVNGRAIPFPNGTGSSIYRTYRFDGKFLGIFRYEHELAVLKPEKVFL